VVSNVGGARAASRGQGGSSAGSPSAASRSLAVPGVSPTTAVYGFGSNRHQVLGKIAADVAQDGGQAKAYFSEPVCVNILAGRRIAEVSCGGNHTVAIERGPDQDGGEVLVCGLGTCGRVGVPRPQSVEECKALFDRSGYAKEDFLATEQGRQFVDEILDATANPKWCLPIPVRLSFKCMESKAALKIVRVSCGMDHTLALTEQGRVFVWGQGSYGNLGTGTTDDRWVPTEIGMFISRPCSMVAAATKHSMALTRTGVVYSWGHGGNGRLGQGTRLDTPHILHREKGMLYAASLVPAQAKVNPGTVMRWIAVGEAHSASIDTNGYVYCWGAGSYGRLGHGEDYDEPAPKLVRSLSSNPCMQVALGTLHSVGLSTKGRIFTWGSGAATGQGADMTPTPKEIHSEKLYARPSNRIVEIAAGCFHCLALLADGDIFSWGLGSEGRLGLGASRLFLEAKDAGVGELADQAHPLQLRLGTGQFLKCWDTRIPLGAEGMLQAVKDAGDGTETNEESAPLLDLEAADEEGPGLRTITCGGMHSGALSTQGELWLWGSGEFGQTGSGSTEDIWQPTQVTVGNDSHLSRQKVSTIAFGLEHCLILTSPSGSGAALLFAWGRNHSGQLGLGNTTDKLEPTRVEHLSEVVAVAAGEDHSAAILESGELYTWGCGESGKLGHGGAMTAVTQAYPRLLRLADHVARVSCGSQHTAAVNSKGELLTWGAGWFGRLGHGNMSNLAQPKVVSRFAHTAAVDLEATHPDGALSDLPAPRILEVQCGSYHTCAVSAEQQLWVCGRDWTVCEITHASTPFLFDNKIVEPLGSAFKVKLLAVGAQHTLCMSTQGSLWAWGDNAKGQLGLGPGRSGHKILEPSLVTEEEYGGGKLGGEVVSLAAGYAHSLLAFETGVVYAWGHRGGGRLGLARDLPRGQNTDVHAAWVPERVKAPWQGDEEAAPVAEEAALPIETTAAASGERGQEDDDDDEEEAAMVQERGRARMLSIIQRKLQNEDPEQKAEVLSKQEEDLKGQYLEYIQHIFTLWDPPPGHGDEVDAAQRRSEAAEKSGKGYSEWILWDLQGRMDRSLCRNLKRMGLADDYPSLEKNKIHPDIASRLVHFEELAWHLQQQPCYLARLSRNLKLNDVTIVKCLPPLEDIKIPKDLFPRVVQGIFHDLKDDRTRHLFMALMRMEMKLEIQHPPSGASALNVDWIFNPSTSKVHELMCMFIMSPTFKDFHSRLFNPDDKDSLMRRVENWTLFKANPEDASKPLLGEALFALQEHDIMEYENKGEDKVEMEHLRTRLHDELNTFQQFLGVIGLEETDQAKPDERADTLLNFVEGLDIPDDIQAVLAKGLELVKESLEQSGLVSIMDQVLNLDGRGKKRQMNNQDKKIYDPIMRLFMGGALGHVIEHHEKVMSWEMQKSLKTRTKASILKTYASDHGAAKADESHATELTSDGIRRVHFNMRQLGRFLKAGANDDWKATQNMLRRFGVDVKERSMMHFVKRKIENVLDDTETKLTIDLYLSHYDLSEHRTMLSTSDLLHLSDALWAFTEEDDGLYPLLDKIQPKMSEQDGEKLRRKMSRKLSPEEEKHQLKLVRRWPESMHHIAEQSNVLHNFVTKHRFLEFHKDLCFCRECEAPIPRSMAMTHAQRKRSDLRLIKVYLPQDFEGPTVEGVKPFHKLATVLSNTDLPLVRSKEFLMMKYEFEEYQKSINVQLEKKGKEKRSAKDFSFNAQIDDAKRSLEILKNNGMREQAFCQFVLGALEARKDQRRYLESVENGVNVILQAKRSYEEKLAQMIASFTKSVVASEHVAVHLLFKQRANEYGTRLKFNEVEKIKKKEDKAALTNLLNQTLYPSATYSLGWLRAKKVIAMLGSDLPRQDYRRLSFTFTGMENGDWNIKVVHKADRTSNVLFSFGITNRELDLMKRAGKCAKQPFNNGFVVINCFNLIQLLARINASEV